MKGVLFSISTPLSYQHAPKLYEWLRNELSGDADYLFAGSPFTGLGHPLLLPGSMTKDPELMLERYWGELDHACEKVLAPAFKAGKNVVLTQCEFDLLLAATAAANDPEQRMRIIDRHSELVEEKLKARRLPMPIYLFWRPGKYGDMAEHLRVLPLLGGCADDALADYLSWYRNLSRQHFSEKTGRLKQAEQLKPFVIDMMARTFEGQCQLAYELVTGRQHHSVRKAA